MIPRTKWVLLHALAFNEMVCRGWFVQKKKKAKKAEVPAPVEAAPVAAE
jgi:hypothetical protein